LIDLCVAFMKDNAWTEEQMTQTTKYLDFLANRSKGQIPSGARFLRDFVMKHPAYQHDSIVSDEISYDLCQMLDSLQEAKSETRIKLLGAFA
jgi:glutamate--cysteine ligase catalytic subunit